MSRTADNPAFPRARRGSAGDRTAWLAALMLAPILGLLVGVWPALSVATCFGLLLVVGVALNREFALTAVLVSALAMLGISAWLGLPEVTLLLTKALIGLFALSVIAESSLANRPRIPLAFVALAGVLIISAIFGSATRFHALQALGAYLAAVIVYLAVVNSNLTVASLRRVTMVVLAVVAAQVPIMVVQSRIVASVDDIGGTFGVGGSTQILAVIFGAAWTIALALLAGSRRVWLVPIGLVLTFSLLISQSKAGFVFAAAGTIAVGVTRAFLNPRRGVLVVLSYLAIGAGALAVLFGAYVFLGRYLPGGQAASDYWIAWLSSPSTIMDYLFSYNVQGQAGRLEGIRLALVQSRSMADLLIGQGPGLLSGSALLGQDAATSSSLGYTLSWATSATRWLLEAGLIGIAAYAAAIATAVFSVGRAWLSRRDDVGRSVTAAAVGLAVVYVVAASFTSPWTTDAMAVPFWCLMGIAAKWGNLASAEQNPAPQAVGVDEVVTDRP